MKGLSLTQPWASAIALGLKRVETRAVPTYHRGLVAIHAAGRIPPSVRERVAEAGPMRDLVRAVLDAEPDGGWMDRIPRERVLAVVELVSCVHAEDAAEHLSAAELALGDYSPGRYAWFLGGVWRLDEPLVWRGNLGLWDLPERVIRGRVPEEVFA